LCYITFSGVHVYTHKTYSLITLKSKAPRLTYKFTTSLCTGNVHMKGTNLRHVRHLNNEVLIFSFRDRIGNTATLRPKIRHIPRNLLYSAHHRCPLYQGYHAADGGSNVAPCSTCFSPQHLNNNQAQSMLDLW
jgi:hypothetical protein